MKNKLKAMKVNTDPAKRRLLDSFSESHIKSMFAIFFGKKARTSRGEPPASPSETSTQSSLGLSSLAFDSNAGYLLPDEAAYYMDLGSLPRGYDTLVYPQLATMATNIQAMYASNRVNYVLAKTITILLRLHLCPRREASYFKRTR
jgi:hypothetical protein